MQNVHSPLVKWNTAASTPTRKNTKPTWLVMISRMKANVMSLSKR
jgi:hypothetical protein